MQSAITCLCVTVCYAGVAFAADEGVPEPDALFKQLDRDGDGQLAPDELPEDKRPLFDRLIRKADGDEDGKLSRDEFVAAHAEDASPNLPLNAGGGRQGQRGDMRQRFEMLDRNKDGKVTRDEVPDQARQFLVPIFERLGKDELTIEDFRSISQPAGERPIANRPGDAALRGPVIVRLLDGNRDGRISKAEWSKAGEMFSQLDENDDGELDPRELTGQTPDEMAAGNDRMERRDDGNRPGLENARPGRGIFAQLDANKDGKLTKTETPPRLRGRFDRIDANNDGSLTPEELRKGFPDGNPGGEPNRRERPKRPDAE